MTRSWQSAVVLAGLFMLASCSHQPDQAAQEPGFYGWQMTAKVAINTPDNAGTGYASFSATPALFELSISGPFGTAQTRAKCTQFQCSVSSSNEDERIHPIVDGRINMLPDLHLPIAYLPQWLMGDISEQTPTSMGWQAEINQWQTLSERTVPRALTLSYDDEYRIKILITSWRPLSAAETL